MRPVEEVAASAGDGSGLAHGWILHTLEPVSVSEAEAILREPAGAVPQAMASRLGTLRIFAVPYLACGGQTEFVSRERPQGESHSSLWLQRPGGYDVFVSLYDADAHETGFELLAAVAELLVPLLSDEEFASYARLLERELREGATAEIDEEALEAKLAALPEYAGLSLASTLAEYLHALWHDVEARQGPEHLEAKFLRRRFHLLQEMFPPNPGHTLFR